MFKYNKKGFSLLGVIIATLITSIGLVSILSLAALSLRGASLSKTRLIASGLAQEGIEVVRGIRQSYEPWDDWYNMVSTGVYRVQYNSKAFMWFSNTPLKLDKTSGLYQYGSGDNSPFYRKIALEKISDNELKVMVEIKWQTKGNWHYLTVEDRLWNWR